MTFAATPSQTIGPFFHFALTHGASQATLAGPGAQGERISLTFRVFDGPGALVTDAMIELWQADASGKYNHPEDPSARYADPAFHGFGRLATNAEGICTFETVRPGRTPGWDGTTQAPHINVSVFARGLLKRLITRVYFAGDAANIEDPVLGLVPKDRRDTLMARVDPGRPGGWIYEIRFSGDRETVFFDV